MCQRNCPWSCGEHSSLKKNKKDGEKETFLLLHQLPGQITRMKKWSSVSGYTPANYTPELLYIQNIPTRNKDRKIVFTVREAVNSYDSTERHFRQTDDGFLKKQ